MQLQVRNPGFEYMLESILAFQGDDATDFWTGPLYRFYPSLNRDYARSLDSIGRRAYLEGELRDIYEEQLPVMEEKLGAYAARWQACEPQITAALSDTFGIDCGEILNDMVCNISLNPIEPRYLQVHTFDIFYLNSPLGAIGEAIHEVIHLVWFQVWHREFGDSWEEYEAPSLKWILSEMAVEPIMRDPRLSSINPYFPRELGGCVYPYFYTMQLEGRPVLDTLHEMLRTTPMGDFMRAAYDYCLTHEESIRRHITESEQG